MGRVQADGLNYFTNLKQFRKKSIKYFLNVLWWTSHIVYVKLSPFSNHLLDGASINSVPFNQTAYNCS